MAQHSAREAVWYNVWAFAAQDLARSVLISSLPLTSCLFAPTTKPGDEPADPLLTTVSTPSKFRDVPASTAKFLHCLSSSGTLTGCSTGVMMASCLTRATGLDVGRGVMTTVLGRVIVEPLAKEIDVRARPLPLSLDSVANVSAV